MKVKPLLWLRLVGARESLKPVQPKYRIVYEIPGSEGEVAVVVPDPNWLAAAVAGGVLPPVEVYAQLRCRWTNDAGDEVFTLVNENPGPGWHGGEVVNGHLLHLVRPIGPMTEEQAMEYLVQKDVPMAVWTTPSNRPRYVICKAQSIPSDRTHRAAWRLRDFLEDAA